MLFFQAKTVDTEQLLSEKYTLTKINSIKLINLSIKMK